MAGKGDLYRDVVQKVYDARYDGIDFSKRTASHQAKIDAQAALEAHERSIQEWLNVLNQNQTKDKTMANYYGKWRTNYFTVRDSDAFLERVESIPDIEIMVNDTTVMMMSSNDCDSGCFPDSYLPDDGEDYVDVNWAAIFKEHLVDDSIVIINEVGSEKMRYLVGTATAYSNKGLVCGIDLQDIYAEVEELTGVEFVSQCKY